jgi:hypothetical protein
VFRNPVIVEMAPGRFRFVRNARRAAETLLDTFPVSVRQSPVYKAAGRACLTAIESPSTENTALARYAFVAAAKDAGIFVREGR